MPLSFPLRCLVLLSLLLAGCPRAVAPRSSGDLPRTERPTRAVRGGETRIRTEADPMLDLVAYDAQDLFDYGTTALGNDNPTLARVAFARLLSEFPASPYAVLGRYNLALSAERQAMLADAAGLYLEYVDVIEESDPLEAAELRLHAGTLRWEVRDFVGAVIPLRKALGFPDLDVSDRWHARALLGRIAGLAGDWKVAEGELDGVRRAIRRYTRTTGELDPWSSAMVWFHAAEMYRDRARAQRLLDVDDLTAARRWINQTAGWFLESRRCHKRVLEHRHPEWSGRAAVALGRINEDFRESMLTADTPTELSADATATYLRMLDEQTRSFLEKAVKDYRWLLMDSKDLRVEGDDLEELQRALRRVEEQLQLPDSTTGVPAGAPRKP